MQKKWNLPDHPAISNCGTPKKIFIMLGLPPRTHNAFNKVLHKLHKLLSSVPLNVLLFIGDVVRLYPSIFH